MLSAAAVALVLSRTQARRNSEDAADGLGPLTRRLQNDDSDRKDRR
jgi:hypothetical protein